MSVVSGILGADASEDAAEEQADAAKYAANLSLTMFREAQEEAAPWTETGAWALGEMQNMLETGPGEFIPEEQPGYVYGYEEFVRDPLLKQASATGRLGSGGTLKELSRYASDYATTNYDNFLDQWYQSLNPYLSLAGMGQLSVSDNTTASTQTASNVSDSIQAAADARASGYINTANAYSNALQTGVSGLSLANELGIIDVSSWF